MNCDESYQHRGTGCMQRLETGIRGRFDKVQQLLAVTVLFALFSAGCEERCRPGFVLKSGICRKSGADAGWDLPTVGGSSGAASGPGVGNIAGSPSRPSQAGASAGQSGAAGIGQNVSNNLANPAPTPCAPEGAKRCAPTNSVVELCSGGVWTTEATCSPGEVCSSPSTGEVPLCLKVSDACRGKEGSAVCDGTGSLTKCNLDGSAGAVEVCDSSALCQASIDKGSCVKCVANEHRCTGATLEVCATDGSGFTKVQDCESAALCNALVGACTAQVCKPSETACQSNTLITCNADGSAFASMMPCGDMTCDAAGGDCNACEPGQKQCADDLAMTCMPTGQGFEPTPCPDGTMCAGEGECVECIEDSHCSDLTEGCSVGRCRGSMCSAGSAPNGTACTAEQGRPGTCSSGECQCTRQCSAGQQCGDDGCGGECGSCSGDTRCVDDRCVECQSDSECSGLNSDNRCTVGRCTNGMCRESNTTSSCETAEGATGRCSSGECVCSAGRECDGTCGSAMDSCNLPCDRRCEGNQVCEGNRCVAGGIELYEGCSPDSSGGQGDCGSGLICSVFNTRAPVCWKAPQTSGEERCPGIEDEAFTLCAVKCDSTTSGPARCPAKTSCEGAWCVPTAFLL
jgi:hypothetical protein